MVIKTQDLNIPAKFVLKGYVHSTLRRSTQKHYSAPLAGGRQRMLDSRDAETFTPGASAELKQSLIRILLCITEAGAGISGASSAGGTAGGAGSTASATNDVGQ